MKKDQISGMYIKDQKKQHDYAVRIVRAPSHRTAVVTGASKRGSIGQAIVEMLTGIPYHSIHYPAEYQLDVTNPDQVERYFTSLAGMDTLICSHGVNAMSWFENMSIMDITRIIDVNLTGSAIVAHSFVNRTLGLPWRKQIIFIGSMAYNHVLNASAAYCASKAGLAMLTRCLAWELAPKGYDVFCVHPSNTEGAPMTEDTIQGIMSYRNVPREEAEGYWGAVLPRHRWLQPKDIARTIEHLLKDESGYLSGANLELAGGQR